MKSPNMHMSTAERLDRLEDQFYDINKAVQKKLKIEEENIRRMILVSSKLIDLEPIMYYTKQLGHNLVASQKYRSDIIHYEMKKKFQRRLQRKHGDSKLVVVHEYNPYVDPPRIKFEIVPKHVEEKTSLALSHDDIQESNNEVVVEAPCNEIVEDLEEVGETSCVEIIDDLEDVVETPSVESVKDLEEVVEASCVKMIDDLKGDVEVPCGEIVDALEEMVEISCIESVNDLEEVVEKICMENVGSTIECFEVVDSHLRLEIGLQVE